nr:ribonuclease H-like domain-containing protein [Tanacetum cinerariifolium]
GGGAVKDGGKNGKWVNSASLKNMGRWSTVRTLGYKPASLAVEGFVNSSKMLENQENVESRLNKGYHAVLPPLTWNYMPPKRDLRLIDEHLESQSMDVSTVSLSDVKTVDHKGVFSTEEPKPVRKNSFGPLIIEDWYSNDDSEDELSPTVETIPTQSPLTYPEWPNQPPNPTSSSFTQDGTYISFTQQEPSTSQFTEFSVTEEEGLHKGYDRFQKILSQLNQVQARPDNNDINMNFLKALPSSWSQVALALKTRGGLESMSFDV